jgi:hypothetical protein
MLFIAFLHMLKRVDVRALGGVPTFSCPWASVDGRDFALGPHGGRGSHTVIIDARPDFSGAAWYQARRVHQPPSVAAPPNLEVVP